MSAKDLTNKNHVSHNMRSFREFWGCWSCGACECHHKKELSEPCNKGLKPKED